MIKLTIRIKSVEFFFSSLNFVIDSFVDKYVRVVNFNGRCGANTDGERISLEHGYVSKALN